MCLVRLSPFLEGRITIPHCQHGWYHVAVDAAVDADVAIDVAVDGDVAVVCVG